MSWLSYCTAIMVKGCVQVKEHLEIFASIKGVGEESLDSIVTEMVDEVST